MASLSTRPASVVTEDEPILTTTVRADRAPTTAGGARRRPVTGELGLIAGPLEGEVADVHQVAVAGPGPGQGPVHAEPPQPVLHVVGGLVGGEVVEGDRPLGRPGRPPGRHPVVRLARRLNPSGRGRWITIALVGRLGSRVGRPPDRRASPDQLR